MCAKIHQNRTNLRVKRLARQKLVKPRSKHFTRCSTYSASNPKSWVMGNVGSWKFTYSLVTYLHYVCAKFYPNRTTFSVKGLARREVAEPKSTNFMRCSTYSASNQKTWAKGNVGSWDSACNLVNYLHYVSAKFQTNRTKGLATNEVVKRKNTNFIGRSTYSASNQKILSQGECTKLRLCM